MSFNTVNQAARDTALIDRVTGCLATEEVDNPPSAVFDYIWFVASRDDVQAAYASAVAGGNPNPGGDESVITDGMILAAVQAAPPPG